MGCTCFGGRSSFRNCQYYRRREATIPTTGLRSYFQLFASNARLFEARIIPTTASTTATCTDRYSGRRYRVGTFFIQQRPSSGTYRCECVQRFNQSGEAFMQTRCRRRVQTRCHGNKIKLIMKNFIDRFITKQKVVTKQERENLLVKSRCLSNHILPNMFISSGKGGLGVGANWQFIVTHLMVRLPLSGHLQPIEGVPFRMKVCPLS